MFLRRLRIKSLLEAVRISTRDPAKKQTGRLEDQPRDVPLVRLERRLFGSDGYGSLRSSGAPVPADPTNNFLPSLNVISRPFARFAPSLAWYPSIRISVPGSSDALVQPRRRRAFGAPASTSQLVTVPSVPFTSR